MSVIIYANACIKVCNVAKKKLFTEVFSATNKRNLSLGQLAAPLPMSMLYKEVSL